MHFYTAHWPPNRLPPARSWSLRQESAFEERLLGNTNPYYTPTEGLEWYTCADVGLRQSIGLITKYEFLESDCSLFPHFGTKSDTLDEKYTSASPSLEGDLELGRAAQG
jgi:hypothetical protein